MGEDFQSVRAPVGGVKPSKNVLENEG